MATSNANSLNESSEVGASAPATSATSPESKHDWMDVAFTNSTKVEVKNCVKDNAFLEIAKKKGFVQVNPEMFEKGMALEPSKSYKFRVAAVNNMGVGQWSEVTAFRTITPGAPLAPINVKISKGHDSGAMITWDTPPNHYPILDFAVFLAIKCENGPTSSLGATPKNSIFKQVYQGNENKCHVNKDHIAFAVIDTTGGKPAIIFRIAARNDIGYGPATQVRWLQDKK